MASRSLNKVMLIGNLTRDPELRYTPSGTPVCTFGLATNRSWIPSDGGERQEDTEFHRIVSWSKLAELCAQLLFKGRKVYLEGRIQTRSWKSADGQDRTATEIVIDNMIILDSRRRFEEGGMQAGASFQKPSQSFEPKYSKNVDLKSQEKKSEIKSEKDEVKAEKAEKSSKSKPSPKKDEEVKADDIPF